MTVQDEVRVLKAINLEPIEVIFHFPLEVKNAVIDLICINGVEVCHLAQNPADNESILREIDIEKRQGNDNLKCIEQRPNHVERGREKELQEEVACN